MRKLFFETLLEKMIANKDIVFITCDLGYGLADEIRKQVPDQFFNVGSSEQAGMGIAVGMSLEGKTVFVYSITPFLIYRAMETIRNYVNREVLNVKLIGSGRDRDYLHDGFSHDGTDDYVIKLMFGNISFMHPSLDQIPEVVERAIIRKEPFYINLQR